MKSVNHSRDIDTNPCIYQGACEPKPDFLTGHEQRVREWLSRTPFAALMTALRNGTRQDQLKCMLQVESWLLKCHPAAVYDRYTRKRFLEEMQSHSRLFGFSLGSGFLREYQNMIPRKVLMQMNS